MMRIVRKSKVFPVLGLALSVMLMIAYIILVSPKRILHCLPASLRYFTRDYGTRQQAALPKPTAGNRVRLLVNGNEALPEMLDLINHAQHSIRWQVMLFFPDAAGNELASALATAARRGVNVQLSFNIGQSVNGTIADGFSQQKKERLNREMQAMLAKLHEAGVEVRSNPAGIDFSLEGVSPGARAAQRDIQNNACISANHYDHRKMLIFDHNRAVIGGMNVGDHYLYHIPPDLAVDMVEEARQRRQHNLPETQEKWLDAAFIFEGPVVTEMITEFDWKWEVLGGQTLPIYPAEHIPDGVPVQFLRQRPGLLQVGARFFELVDTAQNEIYIASPYVSFDPAVEALQRASRRGVRVVFIHPRSHQEMPIARRIFADYEAGLTDAGVELYYNDLRMAHTKLMVVDGKHLLIGSFNLNHRSFRHDLETAAVLEDEILAQQVIDSIFLPYMNHSSLLRDPVEPHWNLWNWILKPFS
jgi:cardiolipin synthase A/B